MVPALWRSLPWEKVTRIRADSITGGGMLHTFLLHHLLIRVQAILRLQGPREHSSITNVYSNMGYYADGKVRIYDCEERLDHL